MSLWILYLQQFWDSRLRSFAEQQKWVLIAVELSNLDGLFLKQLNHSDFHVFLKIYINIWNIGNFQNVAIKCTSYMIAPQITRGQIQKSLKTCRFKATIFFNFKIFKSKEAPIYSTQKDKVASKSLQYIPSIKSHGNIFPL